MSKPSPTDSKPKPHEMMIVNRALIAEFLALPVEALPAARIGSPWDEHADHTAAWIELRARPTERNGLPVEVRADRDGWREWRLAIAEPAPAHE